MRKWFLLGFLFFNVYFSKGQSGRDWAEEPLWFWTTGVQYNAFLTADVNVWRAKVLGYENIPMGVIGFRFGSEFGIEQNKIIISPKVGYEFSVLFLSGRLSVLTDVYDRRLGLRGLPEIGLTYAGLASMHYGYNQVIGNKLVNDMNKHRISVSLTLCRDLWKDAF